MTKKLSMTNAHLRGVLPPWDLIMGHCLDIACLVIGHFRSFRLLDPSNTFIMP
jgi:hypothetical protein